MTVTPNRNLPIDTLGYYTFKRSYVAAIEAINRQFDLNLPIVTVGKVSFQENVRANLNAIGAALGLALPVNTLGGVNLKTSFVQAMLQVDEHDGVGPTQLRITSDFPTIFFAGQDVRIPLNGAGGAAPYTFKITDPVTGALWDPPPSLALGGNEVIGRIGWND